MQLENFRLLLHLNKTDQSQCEVMRMSVSGKKWSDTSQINPISESCGGRESLKPFNQLTGTSDRVYWALIGSSRRALKNQVSGRLRLICSTTMSRAETKTFVPKVDKIGFPNSTVA